MAKKYIDVWKYPHMTYKKAFVIATISVLLRLVLLLFLFLIISNLR